MGKYDDIFKDLPDKVSQKPEYAASSNAKKKDEEKADTVNLNDSKYKSYNDKYSGTTYKQKTDAYGKMMGDWLTGANPDPDFTEMEYLNAASAEEAPRAVQEYKKASVKDKPLVKEIAQDVAKKERIAKQHAEIRANIGKSANETYNANETNLKRANDMLVIFLSLVIVVSVAVLIKNIAMLKSENKKSAPIKKQVKEPVKNNVAHKTEEHFPTIEEAEAMSVEELIAGIEEADKFLADTEAEFKAAKEKLRIAEIERNNLIKANALKNLIPPDIAIDSRGLPYKTNRVYGYGKLFNVFVAKNGEYFHRSKCGYLKHHQKFLLHRYEAIKLNYSPCPFCHPISTVDKWYLDYENYMHNDKNN